MKRPLGITLLVLLVWLAAPAPASAGLWAWLEEWSGPGPFKGYTFLFTACVQDRTLKPSPISRDDTFHVEQYELARGIQAELVRTGEQRDTATILRRLLANPDPRVLRDRLALRRSFASGPAAATPPAAVEQSAAPIRAEDVLDLYKESTADSGPGHRDPRPICAYVDQGFFHAAENPARGFGKIRAHLTDVGPSARIHDGVDVGAGIGWVTFSGDRVNVPAHFTITPIRLILRPITLAVPEEHRARWMGVLNIYWKETYVKGRLSAEQFGSTTDNFSVNGELIRSFGFNVDITALFPAKWRFQ
jgi:hypothetical protein